MARLTVGLQFLHKCDQRKLTLADVTVLTERDRINPHCKTTDDREE